MWRKRQQPLRSQLRSRHPALRYCHLEQPRLLHHNRLNPEQLVRVPRCPPPPLPHLLTLYVTINVAMMPRPPQVTCTPEGAWRFSSAFPVRSALRQQVLRACGFEARADGTWTHPTYRPDGAQCLLTLVQQHEERLRHAWDRPLVAALHDVAPLPRLLPPEKSMPAMPPKAAPKSVTTATRPMCRWRPPERPAK